MEPEDLLNFENDPQIKQKLGNEKIMYSDKIQKRNSDCLRSFKIEIC